MYIGIGPEAGKKVSDEDAFDYACKRIFSEPREERVTAMEIFRESGSFQEAEERLIEWFYSGNWIREDPVHEIGASTHRRIDDLEMILWIRYSDGAMACSAGYREALKQAEEHIRDTELTYLIY